MAKRAEIAGQGLIILDATGVADRYGTNERSVTPGGGCSTDSGRACSSATCRRA